MQLGKENHAAVAFVVRDSDGNVIALASTFLSCGSPLEAGHKAIDWSSAQLEKLGWRNLTWSSDSKLAVEGITSSSDPGGWYTRYDILLCRRIIPGAKLADQLGG